jgi:glycosyltransferase involved in cell wall biosynthesis
LKNADLAVSVTPTWCAELSQIANKRVELVHNGYDEADIVKTDEELDTKFSLVHIGSLNATRNPQILWQALSDIVSENSEFAKDLKIRFVGNVESLVIKNLADQQLSNFVDMVGYIPHSEAIRFQQTSPVLLLLINNTPNAKGILTGKFYEYMASERPILVIGPKNSDVENLVNETQCGVLVDFDDVEGMKQAVLDLFEIYKKGELKPKSTNYQQYSRKAQCGILAELLNKMKV